MHKGEVRGLQQGEQFEKNNFPFDQLISGLCKRSQSSPKMMLEEPVSVTLKVIRSTCPPIRISNEQRRLIAPAIFREPSTL